MYESLIEATVLTVLPLPPDELMIPWDTITLPIIALVLMVIWGVWKWSVIRHFWKEFRSHSGESDKLHLLNSFAFGVLGLILVILFFGVLAAIGKLGVSLLSPGERDEESLRWLGLTIFGLLTALGGILGAPLAIIRINTTERQTRISEKDARIKKREYTASLINRATKHLGAEYTSGHPNISTRIGGLLTLERISREEIRGYHVRIIDMICAYIRANSAVDIGQHARAPQPVTEDIRTAIDILSDRPGERGDLERRHSYRLNLARTNLEGVDFVRRNGEADFSHADFREANLTDANLRGANLWKTDFRGAKVTGANFADSLLEYTKPDSTVISEYVEKDKPLPYEENSD